MTTISTPQAPAAIGPYSQAVVFNGLIFASGQLPIDPATGAFPSDDPAEQARQCLRNLAAIARAGGSDLSRAVKVTVLMRDLARFGDVNDVFREVFTEPYPARTTFEASGLPRGAQVEIDAIIAVGSDLT
ncbi:Rid family detoxifying hydrolase [Azospirillum sp. B506]|uniref:Rid family detoxifying hydrolase n=1 Tax=Azospirillum sp. B506 TaxID=137721 RepID=UPI00034B5B2E|nr:Rid family detoxifying hydrolase [Azospirillum sp. B506]